MNLFEGSVAGVKENFNSRVKFFQHTSREAYVIRTIHFYEN